MNKDFIKHDPNNIDPRPTVIKKCKCGCGYNFKPSRSNQVFLNKRHADYYHHHFVRKPKEESQNEIIKIHKKNDRISEKHVLINDGNPTDVLLDVFRAEGFNFHYNQGSNVIDDKEWIFTYNYMYTLVKKDDLIYVSIQKR